MALTNAHCIHKLCRISTRQPISPDLLPGLLPWEPSPGPGASTHQLLPPHRHRHRLPFQPGGLHAQDASKAAPPQLPNMSHITTRYQARSCALCNTELEESVKARVCLFFLNCQTIVIITYVIYVIVGDVFALVAFFWIWGKGHTFFRMWALETALVHACDSKWVFIWQPPWAVTQTVTGFWNLFSLNYAVCVCLCVYVCLPVCVCVNVNVWRFIYMHVCVCICRYIIAYILLVSVLSLVSQNNKKEGKYTQI